MKFQKFPSASIPIVDLEPWLEKSSERASVARIVYQACLETGFFYVKNHGISLDLIANTFQIAQDFFHLDEEVKQRVHYNKTGELRGYIPLRGEGLKHGGDLKEAFDCAPDYEVQVQTDGPSIIQSPSYLKRMLTPNIWPEKPIYFRKIVTEYIESLVALSKTMFSIFAVGFGLPENYFADKLKHPIAELRLLHYPPQNPLSSNPEIGIDAHCDSEAFTLLAQNEIGGIRLRTVAGEWGIVEAVPGTLLVLIGDMLARWTNDVFTATSHCVVNTFGQDRYSLPFFFGPSFDTVVSCLEPCQSLSRPVRYKPVIAGEYLVERLLGNYGDQPRIV